jgi:predicted NAD/FAD-dependent oxidoreductase
MSSIAIIGAGLSGATAAQKLVAAGHTVSLFDKGRGPGGRMSTRRVETALGQVRFDHGAQFFTARSPGFIDQVQDWTRAGACAPWTGHLVKIGADGKADPLGGDTRFCGVGGMSSVVKAHLAGLNVTFGAQVTAIEGAPKAWQLRFSDDAIAGPFDLVLIAVPAEQTAALIGPWVPDMAAEADAVKSAPCWAAMAVFDRPIETVFDGARLETGPIRWMARENSKPGRPGPEAWILHGSPDWSRAHLEAPQEAVAQMLLDALASHAELPTPIALSAHRWRYAQIETPAATGFGLSEDLGLGVCGDWRLGPRIEFAYRSGAALAQAVMA